MEKLIYYDCSNIVMACQQLFQYIVRQIQSIEFQFLMSALMSSLIYPCLLLISESQLRMSASVFFDSLRYMPLVLSLHHLDWYDLLFSLSLYGIVILLIQLCSFTVFTIKITIINAISIKIMVICLSKSLELILRH